VNADAFADVKNVHNVIAFPGGRLGCTLTRRGARGTRAARITLAEMHSIQRQSLEQLVGDHVQGWKTLAAPITLPDAHPNQRHSLAVLDGDHVQGRKTLAALITLPDAHPTQRHSTLALKGGAGLSARRGSASPSPG